MVRARALVTNLFRAGLDQDLHRSGEPDQLANFVSDLPLMILHNFGRAGALRFGAIRGRADLRSAYGAHSLTMRRNSPSRGFSTCVAQHARLPKGSFFLEVRDESATTKQYRCSVCLRNLIGCCTRRQFRSALFHNPLAFQLARDRVNTPSRYRFVRFT